MAGFYETWFQSPGFGPNWMHDPVGNAFWGSVGKMIDDQVSRMKTGLRSRYPGDAAAMGMADALELIGRDRMLPRGSTTTPGADNETLADWATRLQAAWDTWAKAGTPQAILTELAVQGFPIGETGTNIFNHLGMRYYLDGTGAYCAEPETSAITCVNRVDLTGTIPDPPIKGFTLHSGDQFYSVFCVVFFVDVPSLTNDVGNKAKAILNQTVQRYRQGGAHYIGARVADDFHEDQILGWPNTRKVGDAGIKFGMNGGRFIDTE